MGVVSVQRCRRFRPNLERLKFIFFWYSNHRNPRSRSEICCRVRTSFLHVSAVELACTFPRLCVVVDKNQFTLQRSRGQIQKSLEISCRQENSRLVTMSHIFVTPLSVVACCVLLRTCSCLSHPFLCMAQGWFDVVHLCTWSFV